MVTHSVKAGPLDLATPSGRAVARTLCAWAPSDAEIWYVTTPDRSGGLDMGRRRAVLATLLTVTMLPTSKGRRPDGSYFDPTGIHNEWTTH